MPKLDSEDYIMSDKKVLDSLPIFLGSVKPTKEEIEDLIEVLKREGNLN